MHAGVVAALFLLLLVVAFTGLAKRLRVPYPILLVLAGLLISLVPHVPRIPLEPDLVFLVFLPPLLYVSAWRTDFRAFRANLLPIASLAFGLVGFTVLGVAFFADHFITALDFQSGFVLGAVVAATDAVAASSIASTVGLPHRVMTLLEGESLLNDATSLLALEFGLALLTSGTSPTWMAGGERLLWLVAGGLGAGLLLGVLAHQFERLVDDGPLEMVFSLVLPYAAYLLGEEIRASGVLSVVSCGLYLSRFRSTLFSASARLDIFSAWRALDFLLNGVVFVLIGLQLPYVLAGIHGYGLPTLVLYGAVFSLVLILLRLVWVFPAAYLASPFDRWLYRQSPERNPREIFVVGWTGMRGVVALAAAISLPETLDPGKPFAQRDLLIFLTFSIILVTLVLQGLTLPALVRALGLGGDSEAAAFARGRQHILRDALTFIQQTEQGCADASQRPFLHSLRLRYSHLLEEVAQPQTDTGQDPAEPPASVRVLSEVLEVQRASLARLELAGELSEELARRLERQLDLTETRVAER